MKIGMYAGIDNGFVHDHSIDYIAIDKGLEYLLRENIEPAILIGDFDSLSDVSLLLNREYKRYPVKKDDTDTELAIQYAIEHGYDEIDIYGAIGGRIDHFMAMLSILQKYRYVHITLYDQQNKVTLLNEGDYHILIDYHYFSLFACTESYITLKHCLYELDHYLLKKDDPLCVSNQAKDYLDLKTSNDIFFIQSNDQP